MHPLSENKCLCPKSLEDSLLQNFLFQGAVPSLYDTYVTSFNLESGFASKAVPIEASFHSLISASTYGIVLYFCSFPLALQTSLFPPRLWRCLIDIILLGADWTPSATLNFFTSQMKESCLTDKYSLLSHKFLRGTNPRLLS